MVCLFWLGLVLIYFYFLGGDGARVKGRYGRNSDEWNWGARCEMLKGSIQICKKDRKERKEKRKVTSTKWQDMDFGIHENLFLQILCGFSGSVYLYNARIHILYLCIHAHI